MQHNTLKPPATEGQLQVEKNTGFTTVLPSVREKPSGPMTDAALLDEAVYWVVALCILMFESTLFSSALTRNLTLLPNQPRLTLLRVHMEKMTSKVTTKQASMWQLVRSFLLSIS